RPRGRGDLAAQRLDRITEGAAVEVHHQVDHVAALAAPATVPDPSVDMNRETIGAAAYRTRSDEFATGAFQGDAAACKLGLDRGGFGERDQHDDGSSSRSTTASRTSMHRKSNRRSSTFNKARR